MSSTDLVFNIIGKADSAVKALHDVSDTAQQSTSKVKAGFKALAVVAGGAALAGVATIFKTGYDEAKDASEENAQLAAGLKSTGNAANTTVAQLDNLAGSIQGYSGQTDDSIAKSEQLLLTFTGIGNQTGKNNDIFNQATKMTADMAAKMGNDASTNAILLGKALNDPTKGLTALTRVGVSFTDGQVAQIKAMQASGNTMGAQKVILKELNKEFGGAAAAAGQSLPGQLQRAQRSFEDVAQGIVEQLLPVIQQLLDIILNDIMPEFQKLADFVTAHKTQILELAAVVGTFAAVYKTVTVATKAWGAVTKSVNAVMGMFTATTAKAAVSQEALAASSAEAAAGEDTLAASATEADAAMDANPIGLVVAALAALAAGLIYAYQHSETFRAIVLGTFDAVKTAVLAVIDVFTVDVPAAFDGAVSLVTGLPGRVATAGKDLWSWVTSRLADAWTAVVSKFTDAVTFVTGIPGRFAKAGAAIWRWYLQLLNLEWTGVKDVWTAVVSWVGKLPGRLAAAGAGAWSWMKTGLSTAWSWVTGKFDGIVSWVGNLPGRIGRAAAGMWDGITDAFKGAINSIIGLWNGLHFTLGGWTIPIPLAPDIHVPSITLGVPQMPYLARGGMTTGLTAAMLGDNPSGNEVVLPMDSPRTIGALSAALGQAGAGKNVDNGQVEKLLEEISGKLDELAQLGLYAAGTRQALAASTATHDMVVGALG